MTDEPDLRQLSGFRTPLAAAMLSGVLAAAVDIIVWHVIFWHGGSSGGVWAFRFFRNGVLIPRFAFLCSGPAISRRSWKLAAWAWLWAFGFIVLENTWTYVPVLLGSVGLNFSGFLTRMMIFSLWGQTANIGLSGALLGFALTRLYGFRPYSKWAPLLGAIGGIAVFLVVHLLFELGGGINSDDPKTFIPAHTMVELAGSVFKVVLPTAAIEYSWRQQARAANSKSKI